MAWRFPGCCCLPTAAPSTGIGVWRRSRCLEPMTERGMAAAPRADGAALRPLAWACAAFAGGVLLNCDRVPAWTAAAALLLIAWRLTTERSGARLPGTVVRALLALAVVAVVLLRFHTLNGLAAGTALLMLMAALKLLETRARRDQLVMVGAGLFLLLSACPGRPSLARRPPYAPPGSVCCTAVAVVACAGFGEIGRAHV